MQSIPDPPWPGVVVPVSTYETTWSLWKLILLNRNRWYIYAWKLFVLWMVTWNYNCLLKIIINYLKLYNCEQTNDYYWIEIDIFLKSYNYVWIISIGLVCTLFNGISIPEGYLMLKPLFLKNSWETI